MLKLCPPRNDDRIAVGLNVFSVILAALTIFRVALVCFATPIIGYANNGDFFRQSACLGAWQDYGTHSKFAAHMTGPIDRLSYDGERIDVFCLRSSDNLFPWAVAHLHGKHTRFALRDVGTAKAIAAILAMLIVLAQPVSPALRAALALVFLLALGDIATLAYLNTLYLDSSAILSATALAALAVTIAARRTPPEVWLCGAGAVLLFWLGCSKSQFMMLSVMLGIVLAWFTWRGWRKRGRSAVLAAAGLLAPVLFLVLNADPNGVLRDLGGGNLEDTIMATVLPYAHDKPHALRILGLPPACLAGLGRTGFTTKITRRNPCPQVDGISRARLLPLFVAEPETLFLPLWLAATQSQTGVEVLPHLERPSERESWPFNFLAATSVTGWTAALPRRLVGALTCVLTLCGLLCLPRWLTRRGAATGLAAAGGILSLYAAGSAVFGDGYVEVARHEALALSGQVFVAVALAGAGASRLSIYWRRHDSVKRRSNRVSDGSQERSR